MGGGKGGGLENWEERGGGGEKIGRERRGESLGKEMDIDKRQNLGI